MWDMPEHGLMGGATSAPRIDQKENNDTGYRKHLFHHQCFLLNRAKVSGKSLNFGSVESFS